MAEVLTPKWWDDSESLPNELQPEVKTFVMTYAKVGQILKKAMARAGGRRQSRK